MRNYRNLDVWQAAMKLAVEIYRITKLLPDSERWGLTSQMQRASVSIPCNIAEGNGRSGGDYKRFVMIARGSLMELETQIELTVKLGHSSKPQIREAWRLSQRVGMMLTKLAKSLAKE